MAKLFGTDGIRGVVGESLTPQLAFALGFAVGKQLKASHAKAATVAIGRDTRISSCMLEAAVASGVCAAGADVNLIGVVPTPAVSFAMESDNVQRGIMVSASHNSFEYNGLKVFGPGGIKLGAGETERLEAEINKSSYDLATGENVGRIYDDRITRVRYIDKLSQKLVGLFTKKTSPKIIIDCANGSASATAEFIFSKLNAGVTLINNKPDGTNINKDCGSTRLEKLKKLVLAGGYDLGIAFDGDADRCLAITKQGRVLSGDHILLLAARLFKKQGKLAKDLIVTTCMSNLGLAKALEELGIKVAVSDVGDSNVFQKMLDQGACLGGERSGHTICLNDAKTGDGQLTACLLLEAIDELGLEFDNVGMQFEEYPQILTNVCVKKKEEALNSKELNVLVHKAEGLFKGQGRVLLRASGTEPVIRLLVEGKDQRLTSEISKELTCEIEKRFGVCEGS